MSVANHHRADGIPSLARRPAAVGAVLDPACLNDELDPREARKIFERITTDCDHVRAAAGGENAAVR